jgi:hypothetical protein
MMWQSQYIGAPAAHFPQFWSISAFFFGYGKRRVATRPPGCGRDQLLPRFLRVDQRDLNFSPAQPALSNASVGPRSQTLFLITER